MQLNSENPRVGDSKLSESTQNSKPQPDSWDTQVTLASGKEVKVTVYSLSALARKSRQAYGLSIVKNLTL